MRLLTTTWQDMFALALVVGIDGVMFYGAVALIRAVAPKKWAQRKPISCDVCLPFWIMVMFFVLTWLLLLPAHDRNLMGAALLPAYGLTLVLLRAFPAQSPPPPLPPEPPPG